MTYAKDCICPSCSKHLPAHTDPNDGEAVPAIGDWSICIFCGSILRFDENLDLRETAQEELEELLESDRIGLLKARDYITGVGRTRQ